VTVVGAECGIYQFADIAPLTPVKQWSMKQAAFLKKRTIVKATCQLNGDNSTSDEYFQMFLDQKM
jgi:hypothetical protein